MGINKLLLLQSILKKKNFLQSKLKFNNRQQKKRHRLQKKRKKTKINRLNLHQIRIWQLCILSLLQDPLWTKTPFLNHMTKALHLQIQLANIKMVLNSINLPLHKRKSTTLATATIRKNIRDLKAHTQNQRSISKRERIDPILQNLHPQRRERVSLNL